MRHTNLMRSASRTALAALFGASLLNPAGAADRHGVRVMTPER